MKDSVVDIQVLRDDDTVEDYVSFPQVNGKDIMIDRGMIAIKDVDGCLYLLNQSTVRDIVVSETREMTDDD